MVITGRDEKRLQETYSQLEGNGHIQLIADLTNQEDIEYLVSTLPLLQGVVLCAGSGITKPFQFSKRGTFDEIFNVNFFSPVELLRLLTKRKKVDKFASIVFVSSVGGNWSFNPGNGVYGSSKAALNSMMKFCAVELASKKIRVNSVNPGMVHTKLIEGGTISEEQLQQDMDRYPLKRYGETIDVALGIIYLLSDASSWVTGNSLIIDGGLTI